MRWHRCLLVIVLLGVSETNAAGPVSRWSVFEETLTSSKKSADPLWDVSVSVQLTSPSGSAHEARGYWDGGRRWEFRFSPNEVGNWTWKTTCSDASNPGLHGRKGRFVCAAADTDNPLYRYGPIRLSDNRLFFEHADGEPFFFLSCTAWNGVLKSSPADWKTYLDTRRDQRFTAIQFVSTQWRGGRKTLEEPVFIDGERLSVNPEMFQRMDERIAAINEHGLVACPVVLWALNDDDPGNDLSEKDALKLAQYIVDRWGAYQVVWFLAGDCRFRDKSIPRWKRLGQEIFSESRRLVTLHPSGENWIADKFRDEEWFDFIGYQSGHGDGLRSLRWHIAGPVVDAWKADPRRPVVNLEPNYEAHPAYQSKRPHTPQHVRRAAYWSLMIAPPAGVTYGHNTIWVWNDKPGPAEGHGNLKQVGPWTDGLRAPGAANMANVRSFFETGPATGLRPAQRRLARQPGDEDPNRFVTVAATPDFGWTIAYTPAGDEIQLEFPTALSFSCRWYDPRSGESSEPEVKHGTRIRLQPPSQADWVADLRLDDGGN